VDDLADELIAKYDNHDYRKWYCAVINEFGVARVKKWRDRSEDGDSPAHLFGHYVKQARRKGPGNGEGTAADNPTPSRPEAPKPIGAVKLDTVYEPTEYDLSDAGIEQNLTKAMEEKLQTRKDIEGIFGPLLDE
jgi:hypothetical protein